MTLASRKPANQNENTEKTNETESETKTEADQNRNKRPWWQNLPSKKNQKNKVILEEYDKLKSSLPEWPWMTALKNSEKQQNGPLTRKTVKDTVRVVMTSTASTEQPLPSSTSQITTTTTTSSSSSDPTTTITESKD